MSDAVMRPGGIGDSVPRVAARRLVMGRARHVDDIELPRLLHAAFLRSPYAHARILSVDTSAAKRSPGVVDVLTWQELQAHCQPVVGVLNHLPGMTSAPQWPLAQDVARWQGEPVVMVLAESRALAEDAIDRVMIDWEPLDALTDPHLALQPQSAPIHAELPRGNLAYEGRVDHGDLDQVRRQAPHHLHLEFKTERVTAVTLEPRGLVADWDAGRQELTVHTGTQVAHMMQSVVAAVLRLPEHRVRVVATDTGGSFGLKIQTYPDEMAVVVAARMLARPIKFVADRLESYSTDVHARAHQASVEVWADEQGKVQAFEVDGLLGVGAFQMHPRGSVNEVRHVVNLLGAPYAPQAHRAHYRVAFQNKAPYGMYRGVGHPLACLFTEVAMDQMARRLSIDPVKFRRINLRTDATQPHTLLSGVRIEGLSHQACLDQLVELMGYPALREEQKSARAQGRFLGLGVAVFLENSNHGSATYGKGGAPIAASDGCTVRLQPDGTVLSSSGACDTGQGAETALTQIMADTLRLPMDRIRLILGDTASAPVGGGNWGSRGTGVAGEAALRASQALMEEIQQAAGALWKVDAQDIDCRDGELWQISSGQMLGTLSHLSACAYYRPDLFRDGFVPQLSVTRHFAQRDYDGGIYTNGVQASWVEVFPRTGEVRVLRHWVVDDCGFVINPALADEQLRGAVVQGIGQALWEACLYDDQGQLMNASMSEYLTPLSNESPDVIVGHVSTPTNSSRLGAKGVAEAGVTGAVAAVVNAVNDALSEFDRPILHTPLTPDRIFQAIGAIPSLSA